LTFFVSPSIDNGRQSHQNHGQEQNSENEINDEHFINYELAFNNHRLNVQNAKEQVEPKTIDHGSNLSNIAGKMTDATETSPMSEAMSANLSNWRSDNFNKLNSNIDDNYSSSHDDVNLRHRHQV
jgi:hypothetical protein